MADAAVKAFLAAEFAKRDEAQAKKDEATATEIAGLREELSEAKESATQAMTKLAAVEELGQETLNKQELTSAEVVRVWNALPNGKLKKRLEYVALSAALHDSTAIILLAIKKAGHGPAGIQTLINEALGLARRGKLLMAAGVVGASETSGMRGFEAADAYYAEMEAHINAQPGDKWEDRDLLKVHQESRKNALAAVKDEKKPAVTLGGGGGRGGFTYNKFNSRGGHQGGASGSGHNHYSGGNKRGRF